jgi:hypothetical protein
MHYIVLRPFGAQVDYTPSICVYVCVDISKEEMVGMRGESGVSGLPRGLSWYYSTPYL